MRSPSLTASAGFQCSHGYVPRRHGRPPSAGTGHRASKPPSLRGSGRGWRGWQPKQTHDDAFGELDIEGCSAGELDGEPLDRAEIAERQGVSPWARFVAWRVHCGLRLEPRPAPDYLA